MSLRGMIQVIALMAVGIVVFFHPLFLDGRVISANDIIYTLPDFAHDAPPGFTQPHNFLLADQAYQFYPYRHYLHESIRDGEWPVWNPYILCGTSFAANLQSQSYYLLNLLGVGLSAPVAGTLQSLLELLLAGAGMFFLVHRLGGRPGALFASFSYMFCSYNIVWLNHPHSSVAAFTPWLLLVVDRAMREPGSLPRHALECAAVVALMLTAGHPGTVMYAASVAGFYCLFLFVGTCLHAKRARMPALGALALGGALGLGLAAIAILPFWEGLHWPSVTLDQRFQMAIVQPPLPLRGLLPALLPDAFGSPVTMNDQNIYNFSENAMFIGVSPLLVILAVFPRGIRNKYYIFALTLTALSVATLLGVQPISYLVRHLPLLRHGSIQRLVFVIQLANVLAAGIAVSLWMSTCEQPRRIDKIWAIMAIVAVGVGVVTLYTIRSDVRGLHGFAAASTVCAFLLGGCFWKPRWVRCLPPLLTLLVLGELYVAHADFNPMIPAHVAAVPKPGIVQKIEAEATGDWFRIAALDETLTPNLSMRFRLSDVRGYDLPMSKRYVEFLANAFYDGQWRYGMIYYHCGGEKFLSEENLPLVKLMGIRYVFAANRGGDPNIRKIDGARPHMYAAEEVVPSTGTVAADVEILRQGGTNVAEARVSEDYTAPAECRITAHRRRTNGASCIIETSGRTLLVLNEMAIPGWQARIDGRPADIFPVNVIQVGTWVDEGRHSVEFIFLPRSLVLGRRISASAAALTVFLLGAVLWRGSFSRRPGLGLLGIKP